MRARKIQETVQTYLFCIGTIYLFAFGSLYVQVPGLYGKNGLLPIRNVIPKLDGNLSISKHVEAVLEFPSLLIYSDMIGLPPEHLMELICLTGVFLSMCAMIFTAMRCSLVFLILWMLYLSVLKVGQTFLHFQWDILLLETGIITVLVAPLNIQFWKKPVPKPHDVSSMWLVRWLLFRLMFASGVVKLTSQCPTWWGLTALNWHYESQCIPTPLAWYAHQLPEWFQKLSVVGTYYIESLVPFLFFVPVRSLRLFSFVCHVFFQVCIILTGNYNFFNLLTIALCVSLIDDDCLLLKKRRKVTLDWSRSFTNSVCGGKEAGRIVHGLLRFIVFVTVVVGSVGICWYFFEMRLDVDGRRVLSNTGFTNSEFSLALSYAVPAGAVLGGMSLALELLYAFRDSVGVRGVLNKLWSLVQTLVMSIAIIGMFSISLVSHGVLDRSFQSQLPRDIIKLYTAVQPYEFTHSYGLFRSMTGVGGRPELVIKGSNSAEGPWLDYNFSYKPGDVTRPPPYVFPHQPRLDWQMWFAALGNYQHNPWLVSLVYKLLLGQEEVMELMAPSPFQNPPHFIRVDSYTYRYTSYDHSKPLFQQANEWWTRKYKDDYLFSLSLEHKGLSDFLNAHGFNFDSTAQPCQDFVCAFLDLIRKYSRVILPHELLWMLFFTVSVLNITISYMAQAIQNAQKESRVVTQQVDTTQSSIKTDEFTSDNGKTNKKKKSSSAKRKNATNKNATKH